MSNFTWDDMIDGLDSGLDIVASVAAIIPGGQGIAMGAKALDMVVEATNSDTNTNKIAKEVTKYKGPIEASKTILEAIVQSKTEKVSIDNETVIDFVETLAKSTGNKVDDKLICLIKAYLECDKSDDYDEDDEDDYDDDEPFSA